MVKYTAAPVLVADVAAFREITNVVPVQIVAVELAPTLVVVADDTKSIS